ncbi:CerR family C-terminal domain-containing protein [Gemmata sp. JC717]|uniref:CerR family C-terminal domain-containing protein n=1 Tax=Gemmata algarum TaxID=2975278 RepID=UPI0021BADBA1|nr:CerR family C-terminal domain-containing protein [Gemmata algarum]MDY3553141.1 CerR family C-terminal domain-containing protein [Gemmata algarum]
MSETSRPPADESGAYDRVLAAAQEVFAERGFKAATVREICQAAGANIAAINYYFGGKEQLYIEAVKRAHVCAGRVDDLAIPPDAPAVEKLRAFVTAMVTKMHAPVSPSAMKLMMREMSDPGRAAHVVVNEFIQPAAFALLAILRELLPHLDEHRLLMTGFSVMGQCLFYRQNIRVAELIFGKEPVAALDAAAVAEHVVRFTLAALGHAPPVGAAGPQVEKR